MNTPAFTLELRNLSKSYGDLPVWSNLSLTLNSGRAYCLMGSSGSGKTTLLRILLGLETADAGSAKIHYQKEDTKSASAAFCRMPASPDLCRLPLVSVFQEDRLCEAFSPLDNVMLAADPALSRQDVYRELCRLLPEESVLRPARTLSGGMKRRVAIVRAMLAPSAGILMDEPFTGLDEDTRQTVIRYILEKADGKLLLAATHQEEDVAALGAELIRLS